MTTHQKNNLQGVLWAMTAVVVWSGSVVLLRLGVTTVLNAHDLTALRFGTAAAILAPIMLKRGFAYNRLKHGGLILVVGGFGARYIILFSLALKTTTSSTAGAFNPGIMALVSVILAAVVFQTQIGRWRLAGMCFIGAGLVLSTGFTATGLVIGDLILILTGAMWAIYGLTVRKAGIPALHATTVVAVGSALLYLPIYAVALPKDLPSAPLWDIFLQVGFQGVLVSVVAVYSFNRSAEILGPVNGATLPALIPLVTLGLGAAILNEPAGVEEMTIAIIIGIGVALILGERRKAAVRSPKSQ